MFMQRLRRLRRVWLYMILGLMFLSIILGTLDIRFLQPGTCDTLPEFRADVPQDLRDTLTLLQENELLYCKRLREGLATIEQDIYWGSDGMNSYIFFQAIEGQDLKGVGVPDYTFSDGGNDYFPSRQGDRRHPRFNQTQEGGRIWRNLAEGDAPQHYWRVDGAPGIGTAAVYLKVRGPAVEQDGLTDRDFFDDLERGWNFVRGNSDASSGPRRTSRDTTLLFSADRWKDLVHRETNPALLNEAGDNTDFSRLAQEIQPDPMLYETVQGLTGSTVWVAGVVSGTNPSMVLIPTRAPDSSEPIETIEDVLWDSFDGGSNLKLFHFPRQPEGQIFEALFWSGSDTSGEPDKRWPVVFTVKSVAPEEGEATEEGETSFAPSMAPFTSMRGEAIETEAT